VSDNRDTLSRQKIPKNQHKKVLELIGEFSKVAICKVNILKLVIFLDTRNKLSETDF
jgi:hypothetical protein